MEDLCQPCTSVPVIFLTRSRIFAERKCVVSYACRVPALQVQRTTSMCVSTREQPNSRPGSLRRSAWVGLSASTLLALAACGGGGGGGSDAPSQPSNPAPTNNAPTAQAGADQTITLPTNSAQLQGSATDDGLPTPA